MKRVFLIFALCMTLLQGCTSLTKSFEGIKPTTFDLVSVSPRGLSALDAVIEIGVENPTIGFTVSDLNGLIKMHGDSCMVVTAEPFKVKGHSNEKYQIPLQGALAGNFNPFQLLTVMTTRNLDAFTVDVSARVTLAGGIGKNIEYKDLKVSSMIDKL